MLKKFAVIGMLFVVAPVGSANADPAGATPNDEHNSYAVCSALNANPTTAGLRGIMLQMAGDLVQQEGDPGVKDDVIDAVAYAVLYTCPQYGYVLRNAVESSA